jgi:hypothetical protein
MTCSIIVGYGEDKSIVDAIDDLTTHECQNHFNYKLLTN